MTAAAPNPDSLASGVAGPRHVAIIMDGNGRWAKARRLPRVAGHRAGVDAVRKIVRAAPRLGIETLTLYAFSSDNWKRQPCGKRRKVPPANRLGRYAVRAAPNSTTTQTT